MVQIILDEKEVIARIETVVDSNGRIGGLSKFKGQRVIAYVIKPEGVGGY
jgi:hypothetical protein